MKAGDLIYVPAHITLMEFDESITEIDPQKTYVGPSPVSFHNLEKPVNLLLLETPYENNKHDLVSVLYNGEKMYINKNDILPYQEGR